MLMSRPIGSAASPIDRKVGEHANLSVEPRQDRKVATVDGTYDAYGVAGLSRYLDNHRVDEASTPRRAHLSGSPSPVWRQPAKLMGSARVGSNPTPDAHRSKPTLTIFINSMLDGLRVLRNFMGRFLHPKKYNSGP